MTKKLSELKKGEKAVIVNVNLNGLTRRRLYDLGFIPGTIIQVAFESPLGDPVAYFIKDTLIALRRNESENIDVELIN